MLLSVLPSAVGAVPPPDGGSVEHRVKAAFLYKFAKFVEWPAAADDELAFCVVGGEAFGETLEQTVMGKTIKGAPVRVERRRKAEELDGCSVVFVPGSEARRIREVLGLVEGHSVLTVGDSSRFTRSGGVINFVVENGRVQFEINVGAAERAGLKLSSKLLDLAKIVETQ